MERPTDGAEVPSQVLHVDSDAETRSLPWTQVASRFQPDACRSRFERVVG